MSIENFQFDVNKLKFFGIENDTILLDTSLNINKYYQFNYRMKDNFEFLKFNNIGQVYNKLSYNPNNNFLPKIGFSANKMLLIGQEDYKFYDVAYPLTELFFKTVYSQGQLTETNYARDHHPSCFTIFMAGAGIKKGITYGKTDEFGYNIVENPVHIHDFQATLMHLMGIDHEKFTFKFQGRRYRLTDVHGNLVKDILS